MRQILDLLPEENSSKNLRIDLGRFTKVDQVMINGVPVRNYTMDGFVLDVPVTAPLFGSLTISSNNDDGTTAAQFYWLSWSPGKGTTAYRLWGTNDIKGKLTSPINLIRSLFKLLSEKIG